MGCCGISHAICVIADVLWVQEYSSQERLEQRDKARYLMRSNDEFEYEIADMPVNTNASALSSPYLSVDGPLLRITEAKQ